MWLFGGTYLKAKALSLQTRKEEGIVDGSKNFVGGFYCRFGFTRRHIQFLLTKKQYY